MSQCLFDGVVEGLVLKTDMVTTQHELEDKSELLNYIGGGGRNESNHLIMLYTVCMYNNVCVFVIARGL